MRTETKHKKQISRAVAAAVMIVGLSSGLTWATEQNNGDNLRDYKAPHMAIDGRTLPPIGYVQFCQSYPGECRYGRTRAVNVKMSDDRWNELVKVNDFVNDKISPVTDQELYQVPEHWTYPKSSGDCEDYVLLKRRHLVSLGWPPQTLLITVVRDLDNAGHAVLTVTTDVGDFVLDNQNQDVLPWKATRYTYHKRQSQTNPNKWVSLRDSVDGQRNIVTGDLEATR